ncbi:IPT/TIG domain-containing protein [Bacteroides sp. AN502(2024)]|uniref:IPT/TIG domain-containing protein n=1 Tax=Bacteroides sp. AN502(2024) TaxID=3160599 RepID=UPI003519D0AF
MNIKKSFLYLLACTLLGAGGCSDDDENTTFKELKVFSMTPNEGVAGDEVTITGQGFSIIPSENIVTLNGEQLTAVETSVTILKMTVPPNLAGTFPLMITVNGQTVEGPSFTYTEGSYDVKLEVNALEKTTGYAGDEIIITGKGFSATAEENEVFFGEKAAIITASSTTSLTVTVPQLEPGDYVLTVKAGVQKNQSLTFSCLATPTLKVDGISPSSGHEGTEIVITGENFSTVAKENIVTINGKAAEVKSASAMELTVIAPLNEPGSYKVVVKVGNRTVEGPEFEYTKPELVYTVSSDVHIGEKLGGIHGLAFLPDGRLAVGQRGTAHIIHAFDLQKKEKTTLVEAHNNGHPWNLGVNPDDKMLYIAYKGSAEIGRMNPNQGNNQQVEVVVSGLSNAMDVKFDSKGNMYVLCRDERKVYKYPKGNFNNASKQTFVHLSNTPNGIHSMDFDANDNLIIGAQEDGFYVVSPDGNATKFAGNGKGSTDGAAGQPLTAQLIQPAAIVVDKTRGDIYFTDPYNNKIRRIRPGAKGYEDATVSTITGTGAKGKQDGDGSVAQLNMTHGLAMSPDGNALYFTDLDNFILRKITITVKD